MKALSIPYCVASSGEHEKVRLTLGATRSRILRQLLTESVLLGVLGGGLGLLLSVWAFAFLQQLIPAGMSASTTLELDARVLGFTLGVSLLAAFVFSLAPALQASKADLNLALKQGSGRTGVGIGQRWLRSGFVGAQVALSLVFNLHNRSVNFTIRELRTGRAAFRFTSSTRVRFDDREVVMSPEEILGAR